MSSKDGLEEGDHRRSRRFDNGSPRLAKDLRNEKVCAGYVDRDGFYCIPVFQNIRAVTGTVHPSLYHGRRDCGLGFPVELSTNRLAVLKYILVAAKQSSTIEIFAEASGGRPFINLPHARKAERGCTLVDALSIRIIVAKKTTVGHIVAVNHPEMMQGICVD